MNWPLVFIAAVVFVAVAVANNYRGSRRTRSRQPKAKGDTAPRWRGFAEGFKRVIGYKKDQSLVDWFRQEEAQILIGWLGYFTANVLVWLEPSWWSVWGWSKWFLAGWFVIPAVAVLWASGKNGKGWAISVLVIYHILMTADIGRQIHGYKYAGTTHVEQSTRAEESGVASDGSITLKTGVDDTIELPPGKIVTLHVKAGFKFESEWFSNGCVAYWRDKDPSSARVWQINGATCDPKLWALGQQMPKPESQMHGGGSPYYSYLNLSNKPVSYDYRLGPWQ